MLNISNYYICNAPDKLKDVVDILPEVLGGKIKHLVNGSVVRR